MPFMGCDTDDTGETASENTEAACEDHEDNDGDGAIDCDDVECKSFCEDAGTGSEVDTDTDTEIEGCGVPESFNWTSSDPLITPPDGSVSIKDPTVVFYNGKWHVYATHYSTSYSMVYLSFSDWDEADSAPKTLVSTNPNLTGYKCAPQLFYFAPQDLWYLVYQTQEPAYSTTKDPTDVSSWSAKKLFMTMPDMVVENSDWGGIDYWVICDDTDCFLFFSADNGFLYRARTLKSDFPDGFEGTTEVVMEDSKNALFEASNVYKMAGTDKYLLLNEAIGLKGRYFRSWTADTLDGEWTPLADTQDNPFASTSNVTGADWSTDGISHGEMLRTNPDETMTIDTCKMQYLFQGMTDAGSEYNLNAYSLGLLTPVE
jgi:endo-1,4-beta-xylanase